MSYDLQIWSVDPVALVEGIQDLERWEAQGDSWVRGSRRWQIVVTASDRVLPEDLPVGIQSQLPGIRYLTNLHLEPLSAPKSAHRLLGRVSRQLAEVCHGVIVDPQADTISTPSAVRRFLPRERAERFSILHISWWFTEGPLSGARGIGQFVALLERMLPEALPRRYGLHEPPQHIYAETGSQHFLVFLHRHAREIVVWYPSRPVVGVTLFFDPDWGPTRRGFRSNFVQIKLESSALHQPGWRNGIADFWKAASQLIRPFYGDVRTLNGYIPTRGTYAADIETEFHPVQGPWWRGIPCKLGHAAILGKPYVPLWESFVEAAEQEQGLAFLSTSNWTSEQEVSEHVGGVPEGVAQRWTPAWVDSPTGGRVINWNTEYPPLWPFEGPYMTDSQVE